MKKIYLVVAFCTIYASSLFAQSNNTFTYSMGFGTGDLGDFVQAASFRGISMDFRKMVQDNIGIGLGLGWNTFYEELASDTYTVGNSSLTGKQYRYSNNIPITLSTAYFLKPGETLNPYFGLGIGTMYTIRNTDMNLYTIEQEAWNFLLQPEFGIQYMVTDITAINVSVKYNYGFKAGSELDAAQSYFALNVGFAFLN